MEVEGCAWKVAEMREKAVEGRDHGVMQQVVVLERLLGEWELGRLGQIIGGESFREQVSMGEEARYEMECELASVMRVFKKCGQERVMMEKIQSAVVRP